MHYFGNPRHTQSMRHTQTHRVNAFKDFDGVFLEIRVKNCIVGMLLTCPIRRVRCNFVSGWSIMDFTALKPFVRVF